MFSFEGDWSSGKFLVDTNFPAFKETNRENTPSSKTQALTNSINLDI